MREFLSIRTLAAIACDALDLEIPVLFSGKRKQVYVYVRYIIIEFAICYLGASQNDLVKEFGFGNHSSISHARGKYRDLLECQDPRFRFLHALITIHLSYYIRSIS